VKYLKTGTPSFFRFKKRTLHIKHLLMNLQKLFCLLHNKKTILKMEVSKVCCKSILVTLGAAFVLLSVIEWKKLADLIPSDDGTVTFGHAFRRPPQQAGLRCTRSGCEWGHCVPGRLPEGVWQQHSVDPGY
jgi:hypothetical protein